MGGAPTGHVRGPYCGIGLPSSIAPKSGAAPAKPSLIPGRTVPPSTAREPGFNRKSIDFGKVQNPRIGRIDRRDLDEVAEAECDAVPILTGGLLIAGQGRESAGDQAVVVVGLHAELR